MRIPGRARTSWSRSARSPIDEPIAALERSRAAGPPSDMIDLSVARRAVAIALLWACACSGPSNSDAGADAGSDAMVREDDAGSDAGTDAPQIDAGRPPGDECASALDANV